MGKIKRMSVTVNIPQFLQHIADNVTVINSSGSTVGECLNDLIKQFPQLEALLFNKNGELLNYLEIFINGETAYPDELTKPVVDGDTIQIVNVIVGG